MRYQHETIEYYIKDALVEIDKALKGCENKTLEDGELLPLMEHALHMFNAAFNLRYISRDKISKMSQTEWEKYLEPPEEIFRDK